VLEDLATIEGEYLRDILQQPQALENTLVSLETSLNRCGKRQRD
jgi:hypothetical protein